MGRKRFLNAIHRTNPVGCVSYGTGTSIACHDLMAKTGIGFPEAHLDPYKMAGLSACGHTVLGLDVVMPLFSVCHEASAMGCDVQWGSEDRMPEAGKPIFSHEDQIRIPPNFLNHPGCAVPLKAISLLKDRLGDDAAVCGKVFGSWTQAYHYFGIEEFLITTIDDPDKTRRILERLLPVAIQFARAQIEAGADCILVGDHATRDLCSPDAYREYLLPLHAELAESIEAPLILHICGDTSDRISMISTTGVDCFHWDTKTGTGSLARELAGEELALMGGISNLDLLGATPDIIRNQAKAAIAATVDIVGPECAIPLSTPLDNLMAITGRA